MLLDIEKAIHAADPASAAKHCHNLRGSVANLSGHRLAASLKAMETACIQKEPTSLADHLPRLREDLSQLLKALEDEIAQDRVQA